MFTNKRKHKGGGVELIFVLQALVNKRYVVVKFLLMQSSEKNVCCCRSELVFPSLEDQDCIFKIHSINDMLMQPEMKV
jgi:hypothetical protein